MENSFKIIIVGDSYAGKTCLIKRFIDEKFEKTSSNTDKDIICKELNVNDAKITLELWDTAGQERFRALTRGYYRNSNCVILVYDVTSRQSFDSLPSWLKDIDNYTIYGNDKVLKVLVATKCDSENVEVPNHLGRTFADNNDFDLFMETSAFKSDGNVDKLFQEIAKRLVEKHSPSKKTPPDNHNNYNNQSDDFWSDKYTDTGFKETIRLSEQKAFATDFLCRKIELISIREHIREHIREPVRKPCCL